MKLISKVRDKVRFWVNKVRYDFKQKAPARELDFASCSHIVVSKIDGKLGDTEVMSPFFVELKKYYPNLKISVLCSANVAPLYAGCLGLEHVLIVKKRPSKEELDELASKLASHGKCTMLINLDEYWRFQDFYLAFCLKPDFIAGLNGQLDCININLGARNPTGHMTDYFADLLKLGGIADPKVTDYVVLTDPESMQKARSYCQKGQIALAPWGASKHKHLSDDAVVAVAKIIHEATGRSVALLVPPAGNYLFDKIRASAPEVKLTGIPEKMDCMELAAIIDLSDAMVTVDTATLHLGCASKLPLFAFYNDNRPDLTRRWAPVPGSDAVVFTKEGRFIDEMRSEDFLTPLKEFLAKLAK